MKNVNDTELWKQIPPEEKLEMMSKAHSKGMLAAFVGVVIGCTIAVGLHLSWLIWTSLLFAPLIFQFTAGKTWRGLKPKLILEYMAAHSVARRFAFMYNAHQLDLSLMFRGRLERVFSEDEAQEALEAALENNQEAEVWIALFRDIVVLLSESAGGAKLRFAHLLNDDLIVNSKSPSDRGDYSNDKEIYLSSRDGRPLNLKVTSRHSAAMVVFEKKLLQQLTILKEQQAERAKLLGMPGAEEQEEAEG